MLDVLQRHREAMATNGNLSTGDCAPEGYDSYRQSGSDFE